ncbi:MAG: ABC transporter permease [Chloroflexi bacterium]|nr:ABC transporter permease [Chloroflexota bacterium]
MLDRSLYLLIRAVAYAAYVFLLAPIVIVLIASLTEAEYVTFPPIGLSLRWYGEIWNHQEFVRSAGLSIGLATITALSAGLIAILAAYGLVRYRFPGRDLLSALFLSPLTLPAVVLGVALLQFYSRLGWIGNPISLFLGHLLVATPYALRLVMASLTGFDHRLELAALNLGASRIQAFRRVVLPLIAPGVVSGVAFAFIVSFDDLVVSLFLSSPTLVTLPVRIYTYIDQSSSPMITALGAVLILVAAVVLLIVERTVGVDRVFGGAK